MCCSPRLAGTPAAAAAAAAAAGSGTWLLPLPCAAAAASAASGASPPAPSAAGWGPTSAASAGSGLMGTSFVLVQIVPPSEPWLSRLLLLLLVSVSSRCEGIWMLPMGAKTSSSKSLNAPAACSSLLSSRLQRGPHAQAMRVCPALMAPALIKALA